MEEVIRFFAAYEIGVYIIFGIIILINLKRLLDAIKAKKKANFGLEREVARKRIRSSASMIGLIVLFGFSYFMLVSVAVVRYPGISRMATPTIDPGIAEEREESVMDSVSEIEMQTQTASALTGCIPGQLEWIKPVPGQELSGSVELIGTVNIPNMGFYKYEYRYQGDDNWTPINVGNRPLKEEAFPGRWNTGQLQPGNYFLRLVVSDNQNNLLEPCQIEVQVMPQ